MNARRSLLSLLRIRRTPKKGLVDLPREIRELIYGYYLSDCHVRYYELYHLDKKRILVKRAHCHGPKEHNLLAVCKAVREEAMPVLLKQLVQVLIDNADADIALSRMGSQMSPFLQNLIAATPKIVMSRPAEIGACILPSDRTPPKFSRLEHVEIFGFYPNLPKWLYQYRKVSMGWSSYVVKIWGWESASRPTKNRKIQLTSAATWLHDITARDRSKLKVTLRACAYDVPPGVSSWTHLYVSTFTTAGNPH